MFFLNKKLKAEIWDGRYMYDERSDLLPIDSVPFTIEFKRKWFGRIEGTVKDDFNKGGMREKGKINGKIVGDDIAFIKRMPKLSGRDPLGNPVDVDIPHPLLHYKGSYNYGQKKYTGTWHIDPFMFIGKDGKRYKCGSSSGTWELSQRM